MGEKTISSNKLIIAVFLCGLSYVVLYALSVSSGIINDLLATISEWPLTWAYSWILEMLAIPKFQSPMFLVMPVFAFFAIFFLVDWVNKEFKTKLGLYPVFPALFLVVSTVAFYVALYWYVSNFASLQSLEMSPDLVDFWGKLHANAFMLFIWGGLFGWIARYVVEKLDL